jgi:mRNA degradation ribonuclease J1/J2
MKIAGMTIKTFELAGGMPGTIGYNFQTDQGDIIYMSNFVLIVIPAIFISSLIVINW